MYPSALISEEKLERIIEQQQRLDDILGSPIQDYELTAEELALLEDPDMYSDKDH